MTIFINNEASSTQTFQLPDFELINVTIVGGGSSSPAGYNDDGLYISSAGGSAGASIVFHPIFKTQIENAVTVVTYCAAGGNNGSNGEDSYIEFRDVNNQALLKLIAGGGKAPSNHNVIVSGEGGKATVQHFNGKLGDCGMALPPSCATSFGGNGGDSYFAAGGQGALRYNGSNDIPAINPQPGQLGSGAGGCVVNSTPQKGGDGLIIIHI